MPARVVYKAVQNKFVTSIYLKYLTIILIFLNFATYAQNDTLISRQDTLFDKTTTKLDSIEHEFIIETDSIKQLYSTQKEKIDLLKLKYQGRIDILKKFNSPSISLPDNPLDSLDNSAPDVSRYTHKIDSLEQHLAAAQQRTTAKLDSVKHSVNEKINSLKLPKQADEQVAKLTSGMGKVTMPSMDDDVNSKLGLDKLNTALPTLPGAGKLPDTNLPDVASAIPDANLPAVNAAIPEANLPVVNPNLPSITDINTGKIEEVTGQISDVNSQAGVIQKQVKEATASPEAAGKTIENKVGELDVIAALPPQQLPDQTGISGGMPANGDEAKEQLIGMAKTEAMNHFSGKEAVLMTAMDKMSKYKQKYASVTSVKDLPKKVPNELKGKPFIERVVPALTLQFQSWRDLMLDVNVSAGYRITSRITAGLGWNHRWAYTLDDRQFNPNARVYGVRTYGEYMLKKGFGFRLDVETMNTPIESKNGQVAETLSRAWVWSMLTGIKQKYPITKYLNGNAQIMYNWFDKDHRSPYVDRLNFRIGFEYSIRARKTQGK